MKKISKPYKVPNRKGLYLSWYEKGKRKRKQFNTLDEAKKFREKKYKEVNRDVYDIDTWQDARDEFLERYNLKGLSEDSKIQAKRTLRYFEETTNIVKLSDLNQEAVDTFLKARRTTNISKATVNKEIRYLKSFVRWLAKKGYHDGRLEIDFVKTPKAIKKALTTEQIRALLKVCPNEIWRIRILVSLCTGLRSGDIDRIKVSSVDLKRATIDSQSQKTGKVYLGKPLPDSLVPFLSEYIAGIPKNAIKLFPDGNIRKTWNKIREVAGVDCTRQDFRRTFSTLMQKISGLETARDLLEHSTIKITGEWYSDTEYLNKLRVNKLPVLEWIADI